MSEKRTPEELARQHQPREIVTTFDGLVEALKRETEKLRAVDIYLNDEGKRRLRACETVKFLTGFCETAAELDALGLYDELGEDASTVRDVLMAIERIVKLEKGAKK